MKREEDVLDPPVRLTAGNETMVRVFRSQEALHSFLTIRQGEPIHYLATPGTPGP